MSPSLICLWTVVLVERYEEHTLCVFQDFFQCRNFSFTTLSQMSRMKLKWAAKLSRLAKFDFFCNIKVKCYITGFIIHQRTPYKRNGHWHKKVSCQFVFECVCFTRLCVCFNSKDCIQICNRDWAPYEKCNMNVNALQNK